MKHNKKSAFFLFSFSVYLSCTFLLCTLLFSLISVSYQKMLLLSKQNTTLQDIEKAQWSIMRLLENAPPTVKEFHILKENHMVWDIEQNTLGLLYDTSQKKLYYLQGIYNPTSESLSVREKNLILEEHMVKFTFHKNPFYIVCTIQSEIITLRFKIKPRRGVYKI